MFRLAGWLLLFVGAAARSQEPATDLGAPGSEHEKLAALAGAWEVTLAIPLGPGKQVEGRASCEAEWVLDGRFVRLRYASTFAGKPLEVVRYVGFDRHAGRYVELHFESTHTDVLHAEGALSEDGRTLTCRGRHVEPSTGAALEVATVTTFLDEDSFTLALIYGEDRTVTLHHERKKEAADVPSLYRIILQVPDLDAAERFYGKLLRLEGRRIWGSRHYFDCGPVILALVDPSGDGEQAAPTPDFVYFSVQDLESLHARARALECLSKEDVHGSPAGEMVKRPWGERSFYARDPWGNKLCFVDARTVFTGR